MPYRLHSGDVPVVTAVYPLGLQRGTEAFIQLEGVHLGKTRSVKIKAPADAALGTRLPVNFRTPLGTPLGNAAIVIGEFPEVVGAPSRFVRRAMTKEGLCITLVPDGMCPRYELTVPGT